MEHASSDRDWIIDANLQTSSCQNLVHLYVTIAAEVIKTGPSYSSILRMALEIINIIRESGADFENISQTLVTG